MTKHWNLNTSGGPVAAAQQFLQGAFNAAELDAMLVPLWINGAPAVKPTLIDAPDQLTDADPFAPLMTVNSARIVINTLRKHPGKKLAAVMRACEIRALNALTAQNGADISGLLIIGVECVGTFPDDMAENWSAANRLTQETLQFARQGGINTYRYRTACQMCIEPMPDNAALTIDLLGLPARDHVLIGEHSADLPFDLAALTDGQADPTLVEQHSEMRRQVLSRRARARKRITEALHGEMAMTVDDLVTHLKSCDTCRECFHACPIYSDEAVGIEGKEITREAVVGWLTLCAGCGMCEAACPDHLPLAAIIKRIRAELAAELNPNQPAAV